MTRTPLDRTDPPPGAEAGPEPVAGRDALLEAVARIQHSADPVSARAVVAREALRLVPALGVVLLRADRSGRLLVDAPVCAEQDHAPQQTVTLCRRLHAVGLLEPGEVPGAALARVQLAPTSEVDGAPAATRWRSALVADVDQSPSAGPTRLLWWAATAEALATAADRADLYARHAGLALEAVTERHHLERALQSRTLTGQATGILMHRHRLSAEQAFQLLRRRLQDGNTKLHDVARAVNRTGELPT